MHGSLETCTAHLEMLKSQTRARMEMNVFEITNVLKCPPYPDSVYPNREVQMSMVM